MINLALKTTGVLVIGIMALMLVMELITNTLLLTALYGG